MADVVSPAKRSQMMSGIRGKNSLPELMVRKALFAMGYRFRLHRRDLPGNPDIAMPNRKIAVFVHGCFWHAHAACKYAKMPSTRQEFWSKKLQGNAERDQLASAKLQKLGWRVLCVWECATRDKNAIYELPIRLADWIAGEETAGEIRSPLAQKG